MKEFKLVMRILVMFILAVIFFQWLYGIFGVVVFTLCNAIYYINEYTKKEE
jgi:hypothetical protein